MFESDKAIADLYPILEAAAARCWSEVKYQTLPVGGAVGALLSPSAQVSRPTQGKLADDGASAYIIVQVRSAFGLKYSNFLQADLHALDNGTHIDVFYKNNVRAQKDFAIEIQHWLAGDTAWCARSLSKIPPP